MRPTTRPLTDDMPEPEPRPASLLEVEMHEAEHDIKDVQRDQTPPTEHGTQSTVTGGTVTSATSVQPTYQAEQVNLNQVPQQDASQADMPYILQGVGGGWGSLSWGRPHGGYQADLVGMGFGNHQVARTAVGGSSVPRSADPQNVTGTAQHHTTQTCIHGHARWKEKPRRDSNSPLPHYHTELKPMCDDISEQFPTEGSDPSSRDLYPSNVSISSSSSEESTAERRQQQDRSKRSN